MLYYDCGSESATTFLTKQKEVNMLTASNFSIKDNIIARFYDDDESLKAVALLMDTAENRLLLLFVDEGTGEVDEVVIYKNPDPTANLEEFYGEVYYSITQEIGSAVSAH
jgi:hypothetical protein